MPRRVQALLPLLVIGAGVYAYHGILGAPFVYDDLNAIVRNGTIRRLGTALTPPIESPVTGRPIVNLSLAMNYALGGLDVRGYHAFNVGVHVLAGLLLYGICRRTLGAWGGEGPWVALAIAFLWVVHPLQTETVTYTIQRTESLMALLLLVTLYGVVRGARSSRPAPWYALSVAANAIGMGCKEVMAVAPLLVLAYDVVFLSRWSVREALRRRAGLYAGLAAGWVVLAVLVPTRLGFTTRLLALRGVSRWEYARVQPVAIMRYLRLACWPAGLIADYGDWPLGVSAATSVPSAVAVMALLAATAWAWHRRHAIAFLGVWLFLLLAPTSSFMPILTEPAAERRMYLPLAAVAALGVTAGHAAVRGVGGRPGRGRTAEVALAVAVAVVLAQATVRRNTVYRSPEVFWRDVLAKRPDNERAHNNLGEYLYRQGRGAEALHEISIAVRLDAGDPRARNNLGLVLAERGALADAIAQYREALRLAPAFPEAHDNLGSALAAAGRLDEAIVEYAESLRLDPGAPEAHYNLATALTRQGKLDEAAAEYATALRLNPDDAKAHGNFGITLARRGRHDEAMAHLAAAVRLAPSAETHYNLAALLAQTGDADGAARHLEAALALDPDFEPARRALDRSRGASGPRRE